MNFLLFVMGLGIVVLIMALLALLTDRAVLIHAIKTLKADSEKLKTDKESTQHAIKTYAETAKVAVDALHAQLFPKEEKRR